VLSFGGAGATGASRDIAMLHTDISRWESPAVHCVLGGKSNAALARMAHAACVVDWRVLVYGGRSGGLFGMLGLGSGTSMEDLLVIDASGWFAAPLGSVKGLI
jgi:hypothetical protein